MIYFRFIRIALHKYEQWLQAVIIVAVLGRVGNILYAISALLSKIICLNCSFLFSVRN